MRGSAMLPSSLFMRECNSSRITAGVCSPLASKRFCSDDRSKAFVPWPEVRRVFPSFSSLRRWTASCKTLPDLFNEASHLARIVTGFLHDRSLFHHEKHSMTRHSL